MTALLLDGKQVAESLKRDIAQAILARTSIGGRPPGLAVILVGKDPASEIYVNNKRKACAEVGIHSTAFDFSTISEEKLLQLIQELNEDSTIDGILVQLPLPDSINTSKIIESIAVAKDVDGFHPYNLGRLAQRTPLLRPCTPYGIIHLLNAYQLPLQGKRAVVIGASNIVGRPMAMELLLAGATVTICHRFTEEIELHVRTADILIVAAGVRDVIDPTWLNNTQILVDVGMHRLENGKLRGDVDFAEASKRVAWITPVPGGVGPMTIATLLQNTLNAANNQSI